MLNRIVSVLWRVESGQLFSVSVSALVQKSPYRLKSPPDVQEAEELKRQGLSIRAIGRLTGYKYLIQPDGVPVCMDHARKNRQTHDVSTVLAGTHASRMLRELRERGYAGGYITVDGLAAARAKSSAHSGGAPV